MSIDARDEPSRSEKIVAEFSALRQEIEYRSNAQLALVTLNVTAIGAVAGFALSNQAPRDIVLILAVLCPSLGMLWTDHAMTIENIGDYIRDTLRFGWECEVLDERRVKFKRLLFGFQIFLLFAGPAIASLVFLRQEYRLRCCTLAPGVIGAGWPVGLGLVLWFVIALTVYIGEPTWDEWRSKSINPQRLWNFAYSHLNRLRRDYGFAASDGEGHFNTLFGRDSLWMLILLLKTAKLRRTTAFNGWVEDAGSDIIRSLCETQGAQELAKSEEQPGKIIHEYRREEEVKEGRLKEMAFGFVGGRLYSGFDQTFLFVSAYKLFREVFPDSPVVGEAWPCVERALAWIETYADADGDGLFEYERKNPRNMPNQVWKDSFDSIARAAADVPAHPVAWIEVQSYAHRAFCDAAELYEGRDGERAARFRGRADALKRKVGDDFWMESENCFAVALSAEKEPSGKKKKVEMVASNAGHALWAGIVEGDRERALVGRLMAGDMMTLYGLRTLSSKAEMYAPFAYHRGAVWPFDNAVFVAGLYERGYVKEAIRVIKGVSRALTIIGSPIELYVVLEAGVFRRPRLSKPEALTLRRPDQKNRNQGWTAAALLYFAAVLASERPESKRRYVIALLFASVFIASTTILIVNITGGLRTASDTSTWVAIFTAVISAVGTISTTILTWRKDRREARKAELKVAQLEQELEAIRKRAVLPASHEKLK